MPKEVTITLTSKDWKKIVDILRAFGTHTSDTEALRVKNLIKRQLLDH